MEQMRKMSTALDMHKGGGQVMIAAFAGCRFPQVGIGDDVMVKMEEASSNFALLGRMWTVTVHDDWFELFQ